MWSEKLFELNFLEFNLDTSTFKAISTFLLYLTLTYNRFVPIKKTIFSFFVDPYLFLYSSIFINIHYEISRLVKTVKLLCSNSLLECFSMHENIEYKLCWKSTLNRTSYNASR